jgi:hypothetical protein
MKITTRKFKIVILPIPRDHTACTTTQVPEKIWSDPGSVRVSIYTLDVWPLAKHCIFLACWPSGKPQATAILDKRIEALRDRRLIEENVNCRQCV